MTAHATALHQSGTLAEAAFLEHIESTNPRHPGYQHCCRFYETFTEMGPEGRHVCLVMEPLGMNLAEYRQLFPGTQLPLPAVKRVTKQTLLALDYIHVECGIIHSGAVSVLTAYSLVSDGLI